MQVTPKIFAVSTLIHARGSQSAFSVAWGVLQSALWSLIWELKGEELAAALLLVNLDLSRDAARLGLNPSDSAGWIA